MILEILLLKLLLNIKNEKFNILYEVHEKEIFDLIKIIYY